MVTEMMWYYVTHLVPTSLFSVSYSLDKHTQITENYKTLFRLLKYTLHFEFLFHIEFSHMNFTKTLGI